MELDQAIPNELCPETEFRVSLLRLMYPDDAVSARVAELRDLQPLLSSLQAG